jgi:SAM-dependent methyltransferase
MGTKRRSRRDGRQRVLDLTRGTSAWLRFDAVRRAFDTVSPRRVLEIGSGEGALATWIAQRAQYAAVEPDETSRAATTARLAKSTSARVFDDLAAIDAEQFDLVCAFEVLEHIEDDVKALTQWRELLGPMGHVLLSVPAHPRRFGAWDELAGHLRRYDREMMRSTLEAAAFDIVELSSYGFLLGHALERARNHLARRRTGADTLEQRTSASGRLLQVHSAFAGLACASLAAPFRVLQSPFRRSDYGIGYVVLARATS